MIIHSGNKRSRELDDLEYSLHQSCKRIDNSHQQLQQQQRSYQSQQEDAVQQQQQQQQQQKPIKPHRMYQRRLAISEEMLSESLTAYCASLSKSSGNNHSPKSYHLGIDYRTSFH